MTTRTWIAVVSAILLLPLFASAQADGSVPQDHANHPVDQEPSAPTPPADATGGSAPGSAPTDAGAAPTPTPTPPTASPSPTPNGTAQPATVRPAPPSTSQTPSEPTSSGASGAPRTQPVQASEPIEISLGTAMVEADGASESSSSLPWLWPLLGVLALIPFGFLIAGWMRKKPTEPAEDVRNRCFDIKEMMEEKLKELTDVQALVKEQAIEKGKEVMRDAVSGTATGDLLVRTQKLEEQYKKLKAIYEECQIDVDHYSYKAVLVENSLLDKEILRHVRVISTEQVQDRLVHQIRLSKSQIDDIQKHIVDMKWFFHVWSPGKDDVMVVFKDKMFTVKSSDEGTWAPAVAYGVEQGIPKEELSFRVR